MPGGGANPVRLKCMQKAGVNIQANSSAWRFCFLTQLLIELVNDTVIIDELAILQLEFLYTVDP